MKKVTGLVSVLSLSFLLVACGDSDMTIDGEEAEAKTSNSSESSETDTTDEEESNAEDEAEINDEDEQAKEDDIWTYFEDATWSGEFQDLEIRIEKVVLTESAPTLEDENAEESAVGVKFYLENHGDDTVDIYPDQATLVTSTGEQLDYPEMFLSDSIGGEIHSGVIKEGDVFWYLERGEALSVEWIKLVFNAYDTEDIMKSEEFEVQLDLK